MVWRWMKMMRSLPRPWSYKRSKQEGTSSSSVHLKARVAQDTTISLKRDQELVDQMRRRGRRVHRKTNKSEGPFFLLFPAKREVQTLRRKSETIKTRGSPIYTQKENAKNKETTKNSKRTRTIHGKKTRSRDVPIQEHSKSFRNRSNTQRYLLK